MDEIQTKILGWLDQEGPGFHSTQPFADANLNYTEHEIAQACRRLDHVELRTSFSGGCILPDVSRL